MLGKRHKDLARIIQLKVLLVSGRIAQSLDRIIRLMVPHVSVDAHCFAKVHYSLTELFDTWFPMCRWTLYVRENCTNSRQDYSINGMPCVCGHPMLGKRHNNLDRITRHRRPSIGRLVSSAVAHN